MSVTIKDVAKHAGVSIGTVSRALNNYPDISPSTKEKILQSVSELGYTPNIIGRGLSSKMPLNIGVIFSGLLDSNPYDGQWALILKGIYRYAFKAGLEVSVYATDSAHQKQKTYAQFCRERNIGGAILSGITITDEYFKELVQSEIPCVVLDVPIVQDLVGCLSIDNEKAIGELIEYLICQGNRRFCVIAGTQNAAVTLERLSGIRKTLAAHSIPLADDNVIYCDFNEEMAYSAAKSYIEENGCGVDIFVCMSDVMALGVVRAIWDLGYTVPGDFNVTGFDDIPVAQYVRPRLTTVRQDVSLIGYEGTKLLERIMTDASKGDRIIVPHTLVIRDSVRKRS